ncbi:MAG: ParB N-terminal domain-containing protein [Candidatus Eisenbacteria sp.]|nr:ParB N-terminal domain-containing protein [Candidatus Eisenbacteria bacterium]
MADAKKKTSRKSAPGQGARGRQPEQAPPAPRGLAAGRLGTATVPAAVTRLAETLETDGGSVLAVYRDPLGSHWQILAALPVERVTPTPFQRDLSAPHVSRLASAIDQLDRFLDPVIVVRTEDGQYWTPNGHHRVGAMRKLGARAITALVVPDVRVAYRILALNTEKAHNLRERALEVIRLAQGLAETDPRPEHEFATEFEEPGLLTLGLCYQQEVRFPGSVYHPVLKRIDKFLDARLPKALATREERAVRLLQLDEAVNGLVADLRERGFESPYLKAFVVARINPLQFKRGAEGEFDETLAKMFVAARRFDAARVRVDELTRVESPPEG